MYRWMTARDVSFIRLQAAVFCAECELISQNNTTNCLSCGSKALLNLSRLMGGSLLHQSTANLIQDAALDRVVRELLQSIPTKLPVRDSRETAEEEFTAAKHNQASKQMARTFVFPQPKTEAALENISAFDLDLAPAIDNCLVHHKGTANQLRTPHIQARLVAGLQCVEHSADLCVSYHLADGQCQRALSPHVSDVCPHSGAL